MLMKALIYLLNTGLLALVLYPLFCFYYYGDVSWTGFRLFAAVLVLVFCFLLVLLCILLVKNLRIDPGGRLAAWLLGVSWSVVTGVFLVVKLKGWGEFSQAFIFSLPGMTALGLAVLIRYPQFKKLVELSL
jgi:hypothetical protein